MILNERERIDIPAGLFGAHFCFMLEPHIFETARGLSEDYRGGYWHMHRVENGGFYMAPATETIFRVCAENGYTGEMSADAFGLTVGLYAYSHCSFSGIPEFAEACARQFHLVRAFMFEHREAEAIVAAID